MPHASRSRDFDFELPPELIAQHPAAERSASRLLDGTRRRAGRPRLPRAARRCCAPATCWSFNDTRVIKARLLGARRRGGAVEALVERVLPDHEVLAHLRASKSPQAGQPCCASAGGASRPRCSAAAGPTARCSALRFPGRPASRCSSATATCRCRPTSRTPTTADDERRYQTVFARAARRGRGADRGAALRRRAAGRARGARRRSAPASRCTSAPAPSSRCAPRTSPSTGCTASGSRCRRRRVAAIARRAARGGRVVAVGTTTVRALESAARGGAAAGRRGETDIFITPGFAFRVVDLLRHQLPPAQEHAADAGQRVRRPRARDARCTRTRSTQRYRFFSYGDAMLLNREDPAPAHP